MRLAGTRGEPFPEIPARLARDLKRSTDQRRWTQAVKVRLYPNDYFLHALPLVGRIVQRERGRMQVAAAGHGILLLEEGEAGLRAGDVFPVLLLESSWV
jgi:molybdopterin biosynthesis enzyme